MRRRPASRVDAERLRIAREVHDTVAHAIAIINVQAGVTAHVLDKRPERAREALEVIEQTSSRALREMRAILGVLRDADEARAPHPGLGQIDELTAQARDAGLDVELEVRAPHRRRCPSAVGSAAYRILQESITNVIRHVGSDPGHACALDYGVDALRGPGDRRGSARTALRRGIDGPAPGPRDRRDARTLPAPGWRADAGPLAGRWIRGHGAAPAARRPGTDACEHAPDRTSDQVLLADDEGLVRSGFRVLLDVEDDIEVVGEATDRRRGRRAGPRHPARRRAHGHPDAGRRRHPGHPSDRRRPPGWNTSACSS